MGTVLVTTGAVVPFEALINSCLDPEVLSRLQKHGYTRVVVQYGKGGGEFRTLVDSVKVDGVDVSGFAFTDDMASVVEDAALVVSHAGTGSILDALRAGKKLIVAVNADLMDNHQAEIADEFAKGGHLLVCDATAAGLREAVDKASTIAFKALPPANNAKVTAIIDGLAGVS